MREHTVTWLKMGTVVQVRVVTDASESEVMEAIQRAQAAFSWVESVCSRFDPTSELRQLSSHIGEAVRVSDALFEPLRFALTVAEETDGLLDPTLGRVLQSQGFNRHYLTGERVNDEFAEPGEASYRDVVLDEIERTVTLHRPLTLDLGAVAKGFAVDLAAGALAPMENFAIDAGGDVCVRGHNAEGSPWGVGIRHPVQTSALLGRLELTEGALCTSGGYERKRVDQPDQHHLIVPTTGRSPSTILSTSVLAPYAMMADAFSTVIFLLPPKDGVCFLEEYGLQGVIVDQNRSLHMTREMEARLHAINS